jgi:hypothetical protein
LGRAILPSVKRARQECLGDNRICIPISAERGVGVVARTYDEISPSARLIRGPKTSSFI